MDHLNDLENVLGGGVTLLPQSISASTTVNGAAVDCQTLDGNINAMICTGDCSGTCTLTLEEGADTTTFTTIASDAFTNLASSATANDNIVQWCSAKRTKRYVRITATTGGSTTIVIAGVIVGRKKVTGSGDGSQIT